MQNMLSVIRNHIMDVFDHNQMINVLLYYLHLKVIYFEWKTLQKVMKLIDSTYTNIQHIYSKYQDRYGYGYQRPLRG